MDKKKVKTIVTWTLSILLGVMFLVVGAGKFAPEAGWADRFANWGYPAWSVMVVGIVELVGGIGILIPRTSLFAALSMAVVMLGAMATHLLNGDIGGAVTPLVYLVVLSALIVLRRQKVLSV